MFARSGELLQIEDHAPVRAKYASTAAEQVLLQAYRLNQPNVAVNVKLTKDRNRPVFAADKYPIGGLKLVPYSSNLHSVAVEGKEKVHKGPHIRLKIPLNDFGGRAHIVTFSAESARKAEQSNEFLAPFLVRAVHRGQRACKHAPLDSEELFGSHIRQGANQWRAGFHSNPAKFEAGEKGR